MNGVEILAVKEIVTAYEFGWANFWLGFFLAAIIFNLLLFFANVYNEIYKYCGAKCVMYIVLLVIIGCIILGFVNGHNSIPVEYCNEYKVTIDDSVPMVDFCEKYEVLDQEGKIYTVVERETEE